jgi:hypothetical protein
MRAQRIATDEDGLQLSTGALMANPISPQIATGTIGELLVQLRLLRTVFRQHRR